MTPLYGIQAFAVLTIGVNPFVWLLHCMVESDIDEVSDVYISSIFRVEI
jgi:hypothetical protein